MSYEGVEGMAQALGYSTKEGAGFFFA